MCVVIGGPGGLGLARFGRQFLPLDVGCASFPPFSSCARGLPGTHFTCCGCTRAAAAPSQERGVSPRGSEGTRWAGWTCAKQTRAGYCSSSSAHSTPAGEMGMVTPGPRAGGCRTRAEWTQWRGDGRTEGSALTVTCQRLGAFVGSTPIAPRVLSWRTQDVCKRALGGEVI
jgi:hypothetical protein